MTAVDVQRGGRAASRARRRKATIVLTPVDNPSAYGLVETARRRRGAALPREAERRRDHLRHDQRRHLRARARHLRPHPEGRAVLDRARLLPVAGRARRDVRRLRRPRLLDRHRHAGEVHRRCTATCSTAASPAGCSRPRIATSRSCRPRRASRTAPRSKRPCFVDQRRADQGGRRHRPVLGDRPRRGDRRGRATSTTASSGRTRGSASTPSSTAPSSAATATSAATSSLAAARRCSATRRRSPTTRSI